LSVWKLIDERLGTIKEHWKQIQQSQWYDPTFEDFLPVVYGCKPFNTIELG
jgi:hypothetical protein